MFEKYEVARGDFLHLFYFYLYVINDQSSGLSINRSLSMPKPPLFSYYSLKEMSDFGSGLFFAITRT